MDFSRTLKRVLCNHDFLECVILMFLPLVQLKLTCVEYKKTKNGKDH